MNFNKDREAVMKRIVKETGIKYAVAILLLMAAGMAGPVQAQARQLQRAAAMMLKKNSNARNYQAEVLDKVITLHLENVTLEEALKTIARKAGLKLVYSEDLLPAGKRISLQKRNIKLEKAIWEVLAGSGLRFAVSSHDHLVIMKAPEGVKERVSQMKAAETISGTVTDANTGNTLPGVNIQVKGTTTGTATDANGQYELTVESLQDTLVFSFVGYQTRQVPINGRTIINVALKPTTKGLEQLVVVGYTSKKKKDISGAVSDISERNFTIAPTSNPTQLLQGKASGLIINDRGGEPGNNNANILIRGKATLGNNNPLYVIDGVPRSETVFATLPPEDIQSISVLKDASAAVYGSRAANGVILVTTKEGHKGEPIVTLNSRLGFQTIANFPKAMTAYQRGKYFNEWQKTEGTPPLFTEDQLQHLKNGDMPLQYPNTDWASLVLADYAPQTNHHLSVAGGSDQVQYYISGSYSYEGGIFKSNSTDNNEYQLRARINSQISRNLSIGIDLSGKKGVRHAAGTTEQRQWLSILYAYPWIVNRYPNGLKGPGFNQGSDPVTNTNSKYGFYNVNRNQVYAKLHAKYELPWLTDGLSISGYANFDFQMLDTKTFSNIWDTFSYDPQTGKYVKGIGHARNARKFGNTIAERLLQRNNTYGNTQFYNLKLSYVKSFGKHNFRVFTALERSSSISTNLEAYRQVFPTPNKPFLWAGGEAKKDNNGTEIVGGRVSYIGDISYNYNSVYLFDFSLRNDGSYIFPKGKRFGLFPAVSIGWNISKEPFMDNVGDWLDNLKIRLSWGKLGNDRVEPYQYLTSYSLNGFHAFGVDPVDTKILNIDNVPNPNITWETAYKRDIGIDLTALHDRISFSADYFFQKRRGILVEPSGAVPSYSALSLPDENIGKVNNRGFELSIEHQNDVGDINYHVGGNLTYHKNKIVYMAEPANIPSYQKQEGHPLHSFLLYKADGLYRSQEEISNSTHLAGTVPGDIRYADVNGDGEISGKDKIRSYTSDIPKVIYGINMGLDYKNFGFNVFFQGQANVHQFTFYSDGLHLIRPYYTERWTPDNRDAKLPRAFSKDDYVNVRESTFWLYDASFIRLKAAKIFYTLPVRLTSNIGISNVRFYLNGQNLLTWDHMLGNWDPEREEGNSGFHYPQMRLYNVGVVIKF